MSERLVNVDRETPMLLPVDMRQWVSGDDLVHFVIQAVQTMYLPALTVNQRGSGSRQYPPRMMLAPVIYCCANGVMSSRRIEGATYRDLAVRYLTGDTHPDHDTICAFRRENAEVVVDVGDSRLILGTVQRVVADGGYVNAERIEAVVSTVDLYAAITSEDTSQRRYDYRPPKIRTRRRSLIRGWYSCGRR